VDVSPGTERVITLHAVGRRLGSYAGQVQATVKGIRKSTDVILDIGSAQALFDVKMDLPPEARIVKANDALKAQIVILNIGPPRRVDVFVTYLIKDLTGRVVSEESETFAVFGEYTLVHDFQIPQLEPGKYIASIEVRYENTFAVSSDTFIVEGDALTAIGQLAKRNTTLFLTVIVLASVLFAAVFYLTPRRKKGRGTRNTKKRGHGDHQERRNI